MPLKVSSAEVIIFRFRLDFNARPLGIPLVNDLNYFTIMWVLAGISMVLIDCYSDHCRSNRYSIDKKYTFWSSLAFTQGTSSTASVWACFQYRLKLNKCLKSRLCLLVPNYSILPSPCNPSSPHCWFSCGRCKSFHFFKYGLVCSTPTFSALFLAFYCLALKTLFPSFLRFFCHRSKTRPKHLNVQIKRAPLCTLWKLECLFVRELSV